MSILLAFGVGADAGYGNYMTAANLLVSLPVYPWLALLPVALAILVLEWRRKPMSEELELRVLRVSVLVLAFAVLSIGGGVIFLSLRILSQ